MTFATWVLVGLLGLFLPFAAAYPVLGFLNRKLEERPVPPSVPGRRVLVAICSNGGAADIVRKIVRRLASYLLPEVETVVIVEEADPNDYGARTVVVPSSYSTTNGSLTKHRALHCFSEWLGEHGYGAETYVVHLDDDSVVTERYLRYVLGMSAVAGQGTLRLRALGHHLLSTVADFGRVLDCATYCAFCNARGRPLGVHGEGLAIRADVEARLGWDFQPVCAEDYLMGQNLVKQGYSFDFIPGGIFIAPPTSARDFFNQRRRWMHRFFASIRKSWQLNQGATVWFVWQYLFGGAVVAGLLTWVTIAAVAAHPSYALLGGTTLCVLVTLFAYQWQASQTGKLRWNLAALALFVPAAAYTSLTFFYYCFTRRPRQWISIKKV